MVTIVDVKIQSQPCIISDYTHDETLEGSSCCELLEFVQTHVILCVKSRGVELKLSQHMTQKSGCGDKYT